ncbi:uracil-DNA glycosylase [Sinirhodobacter ferrireducens]|uniref:Type-4 uracil-DNA glycosylase n=1 Tax=Paenirhodobacter ferrireducens TaxID=1215032 RepID=A0A443LQC8_9RHOB|nr:uracil-DNA glycosylase [Sinirhodobacter ferrireducens]RWR51368.1 uracil-DNA glycosylase [Sinirhodobacter ferrireducens]
MTAGADLDYNAARAALEWLIELGVDSAVLDEPVDAYALPETLNAPKPAAPAVAPKGPGARPVRVVEEGPDPVVEARRAAAAANDLEALRDAITAYDLCELKKGAKTTVFADGNPKARVMIIGEAPGRDEDVQGKPFVGRAGHLLDKMFAAIGLSRTSPDAGAAFYITNVLPWRPPGNRDPEPAEIAQMLPFLARHVELADPDLIVLMGNAACAAALNKRGILRLRGHWAEAFGRPALPMTHPAYLLRQPHAKREAWADLLALRARLNALAP